MLPGIVVINPGFIRVDSKVGTPPPPPLNVDDMGGGRGRKEKVTNFRRSVVSFKTSAVTIISGFRSLPFRFFNSAGRRFRFEGISRKRYSSGLLIFLVLGISFSSSSLRFFIG